MTPEPHQAVDPDQLVVNHLKYAERTAAGFCKRYKVPLHAREEMWSAALVGLCEAARKFDPTKGASFETYSFAWMRGMMLRQIQAETKHQQFDLDTGLDYLESLGIEMHRSWDQDSSSYVVDLSRNRGDELDNAVLAADVRQLVGSLPERERDIVTSRFFDEVPAPDVGQRLGISKGYVIRIQQAAVERLRNTWLRKPVRRDRSRITHPRRSMASEPALTRSALLTLRASLEQRFNRSMSDIEAALRVLEIMDGGAEMVPVQKKPPKVVASPLRPQPAPRKPPETNLGPRFEQALADMPERFTKKELVAAVERNLGREISPGSVPFCIERLLMAGKIVIAERGSRGRSTVYRRAEEAGVIGDADEDREEAA